MSKAEQTPPFEFGGKVIPPGKRAQVDLPVARLPTQTMLAMPVTVIHGRHAGPCVWLSAAIHGDELNGVEIVRRVLDRLDRRTLRGTVLAVPIVNVFGFIHQSRYLPDRRDLNRSFPGSPRGSLAARLAHLFMDQIVSRCSHGIDLHTATHHRTNLPQIRANLDDDETRRCAFAFAAPVTIHASSRDGSLREAALRRGIPVLLYEAGQAQRFNPGAIKTGTRGVLRVLATLGMTAGVEEAGSPTTVIRTTRWIRAQRAGIVMMEVALGDRVAGGQLLATIADALGTRPFRIKSPFSGIVIGVTRNPLVNRGDGIVHLGALDDASVESLGSQP